MPVTQMFAGVLEKAGTAAVDAFKKATEKAQTISETGLREYVKEQVESGKSMEDAVTAKLDEIKNMTPAQLRERMNSFSDRHDVEKSSEAREEKEKCEGLSGEIDEDASESDETGDADELSEDEINEKQREAIRDALERIRNGEKLTNEQLGNLGEMMMDQYYISKGYQPLNKHRVTSLDDKKSGFKTGIDGVYEKTNPDGTKSYVIADAKYNTSQLSETNDGMQMSDNWIDNRLDDAVGKEKADEIRDAEEDDPDCVEHEVYHIDPNIDENGNMHTDTQEVDSEGNKVGEKTIVEYYDAEGCRIDPSSIESKGDQL